MTLRRAGPPSSSMRFERFRVFAPDWGCARSRRITPSTIAENCFWAPNGSLPGEPVEQAHPEAPPPRRVVHGSTRRVPLP